MDTNHHHLIQGCIEQDRKSQELLYSTFSKKLYQVCLGYTKNRDEAKDVLQEGFIKIFKNIATYKGEVELESWMRKIVVNTSIDFYRKNLKELETIDIDKAINLPEEYSILETMGAKDLLALIRKLPEGARVIFNLYVVEGYTHKEIAAMLGVSEGTSKSQVSRGKQLLQKMLGGIYKPNAIAELN